MSEEYLRSAVDAPGGRSGLEAAGDAAAGEAGLRPATGVEQTALVIAALLCASGVVHLGILAVGDGSWIGPLSYRKAATFGTSFGLTLGAVAIAGRFLPTSRAWNALLGVFTAACVIETALVSLQAWRHVPSHFNFETPTNTAIAYSLAAGGGVLVLCGLGFTVVALRSVGTPPMLLVLRASFVALLAGFGVGVAMVAKGVRLARAGSPETAYATAGALKPLHAVLLHGVLVLLPLGWLVGRLRLSAQQQILVTWSAIAAYAVVAGAVAWSVI